MDQEQPQRPRQNWIFRGFLIGVAVGFVLGLVSKYAFGIDTPKPYQEYAWPAFWALAFGFAGFLVGIWHWLFRRS